MAWYVGTLRERYSYLPAGTVVALRRSKLKLAVGPCWWIRPQHIQRFFAIAECYGGVDLCNMVLRHRLPSGDYKTSPDPVTKKLDEELRQFGRSLHPLARPMKQRPYKQPLLPSITQPSKGTHHERLQAQPSR